MADAPASDGRDERHDRSASTATAPTNPYAAPGVIGAAGGTAACRPGEYAGFLPRAWAHLMDMLIFNVMVGIPGSIVFFIATLLAGNNDQTVKQYGFAASICMQVLGVVLALIYHVALETSCHQGTWGKQLLGIAVTDVHGRRITMGRSIGRFFAQFVTLMTCGIGYLLPLFTEKKQTLHDLIAGCLVVRK